ncbi:MAG: T9SS type A sorting domain-containing protein [Candidatus Eisenbacteria bacterium]|nr:T9SS type A sorting domain-containing protein [Candidatus Eisenbacteria bacterium]
MKKRLEFAVFMIVAAFLAFPMWAVGDVLTPAPTYLEFPTDTYWKATTTFYENWYALDYNDSAWPFAVRHEHYFAEPWIKSTETGNSAYFRHELNFTYMELIPPDGSIDRVTLKVMANSEFDLWFNGLPASCGEYTELTGPLVVYDVSHAFNSTGKNVIAINARCPASNSAQIYAVLRVDMTANPPCYVAVAMPPGSPAVALAEPEVRAFPNPSNPATLLSYTVPSPGLTTLRIFDASGRLVRTLLSEYRDSGTYSVSWDGKNDASDEVESGVYFCEIAAAGATGSTKCAIVR